MSALTPVSLTSLSTSFHLATRISCSFLFVAALFCCCSLCNCVSSRCWTVQRYFVSVCGTDRLSRLTSSPLAPTQASRNNGTRRCRSVHRRATRTPVSAQYLPVTTRRHFRCSARSHTPAPNTLTDTAQCCCRGTVTQRRYFQRCNVPIRPRSDRVISAAGPVSERPTVAQNTNRRCHTMHGKEMYRACSSLPTRFPFTIVVTHRPCTAQHALPGRMNGAFHPWAT